jgi:hypothetical protein
MLECVAVIYELLCGSVTPSQDWQIDITLMNPSVWQQMQLPCYSVVKPDTKVSGVGSIHVDDQIVSCSA